VDFDPRDGFYFQFDDTPGTTYRMSWTQFQQLREAARTPEISEIQQC
jgi:hypothetical protein